MAVKKEIMQQIGVVAAILLSVDKMHPDCQAYLDRRLCELCCAGVSAAVRLHFLSLFFKKLFCFKLCRFRQRTKNSLTKSWSPLSRVKGAKRRCTS